MCEHCSDGSTIWAGIPRLAAYSKLSERNVQRLIRRFCDRGILSQLAPENTAKHRPVTYRLNEAALEDDPRMTPYRERQEQLPGIRRVPVSGEPIPDRDLVTRYHPTDDKTGAHLVTRCHQPGDEVSPDSKAFDPRATDSKAGGFKNSPPALSDDPGLREPERPEDLAKALCLRINFPATPANMTVIAAALKAIKGQEGFATYQESFDWLAVAVEGARSIVTRRGTGVDRFFFEDAHYNQFAPRPQLSREVLAPPECDVCGDNGRIHQRPQVAGLRLIPCPKCGIDNRSNAMARLAQ